MAVTAPGKMKLVQLTGLDDDLLLPWLDLYETAFPPHEKMLVSAHLQALKAKAGGDAPEHVFLAAVAATGTGAGQFAGLARYELIPTGRVVSLWYLAVNPALRSQGLGSQIYREILQRIEPGAYRAMLFEVEIPELQEKGAPRDLAARRIQFYRRQGALLLGGIHYLQSVGWHQPLTPMHLMVHPLHPLSPQESFDLGKRVYGDYLAQTGDLTLT
jgi:ribosomal protein S18 acetylase RimI-like enzyme